MASDKGQGKRLRTTEASRGVKEAASRCIPALPKDSSNANLGPKKKKKKLAWPQGNALATLKIIIRRRQRKGFPVSHQGVREVSFFLSVLLHMNRCSRTKVKFT